MTLMSEIFFYLSVISCLVVLVVLIFGVVVFARGGDFNRKWANKIMRLRLVTQAIAVVLILVTVVLAQSGY